MTEIVNNQPGNVVDFDKIEGTDFERLNQAINQTAILNLQASGHGMVFKVKLTPKDEEDVQRYVLHDTYIAAFQPEHRQYHTCHCCRTFLRLAGDFVTVDANGKLIALFWNEELVSDYFKPIVKAMREKVESARIDHVVLRPEYNTEIGNTSAGGFNHFATSFRRGAALGSLKSAKGHKELSSQQLESKQDFAILSSTVLAHSEEVVELAIKLFETDEQLKNYPKYVEHLKWLQDLRVRLKANPAGKRNLLWVEATTQPMARVRYANTVLGEYLTNLVAENAESAKKAFLKMVDPRDYMRPKAAPTAGNIQHAESVVAKLNIAKSLERRFLRFDELPEESMAWRPSAVEKASAEGVFGHLKPKDDTKPEVNTINGGTITWARFEDTVLPNAKTVHLLIDHHYRMYGSLATARNPDAPPILRWDKEDKRNPVNSFTMDTGPHQRGTLAREWGLANGQKVAVRAIIRMPDRWYAEKDGETAMRFLVLDGGKPPKTTGMALFPENMRSELHEIRSTIEAFSNAGDLGNYDEAMACMSAHRGTGTMNLTVEVSDGKFTTKYLIDRGE
jgi:hypothetical protein